MSGSAGAPASYIFEDMARGEQCDLTLSATDRAGVSRLIVSRGNLSETLGEPTTSQHLRETVLDWADAYGMQLVDWRDDPLGLVAAMRPEAGRHGALKPDSAGFWCVVVTRRGLGAAPLVIAHTTSEFAYCGAAEEPGRLLSVVANGVVLDVYVPTDAHVIHEASAIVGSTLPDGTVVIDVQGSRLPDPALQLFRNRLLHAAQRHVTDSPVVSRMVVDAHGLQRVGSYDIASKAVHVEDWRAPRSEGSRRRDGTTRREA